jgi:hypothetical protein
MGVQQLPEVRLAQPAVDVRADLDADGRRDDRRVSEAAREIDLAEPAFAEQPLDPVLEPRLRAGDDLRGIQQQARRVERGLGRFGARGGRREVRQTSALRNRRLA